MGNVISKQKLTQPPLPHSPLPQPIMKHCDHSNTEMTREPWHLADSWQLDWQDLIVRIQFDDRGEWTTLFIPERMRFA